MHRNPNDFGVFAPLFCPDYGRGAVGYILKANGVICVLTFRTPRPSFSVTVFSWGKYATNFDCFADVDGGHGARTYFARWR